MVAAAEEAVRYAGAVAACDYMTLDAGDCEFADVLGGRWIAGRGMSFGQLYETFIAVVKRLKLHPGGTFVPEFTRLEIGKIEECLGPLIEARNAIIHGAGFDRLDYLDFIGQYRENLFAILDHLSFLARYPMCVADPDDDPESPSDGGAQVIKVCRGSSPAFDECVIRPDPVIPPGTVFIWNRTLTEILGLSPLYVYGQVLFANGYADGGYRAPSSATRYEGLLRIDTQSSYRSLDGNVIARFPNFVAPSAERLQAQVSGGFSRASGVHVRRPVKLDDDDREKFGLQPGGIPQQWEFHGEKETYVVQKRPVGRGGMAVVYLVRGKSTGQLYALKAMAEELGSVGNGALARRFAQEEAALTALRRSCCENIVHLVDKGAQDLAIGGRKKSFRFIVMEYVDGGNLQDELLRRSSLRPPFSSNEALAIVKAVGGALSHVHKAGLVHGDIKPGNILLARLETRESSAGSVIPKIADFGLATQSGRPKGLLSGAAGTLDYMAPEQLEETGFPVGPQADVYALGKMLCAMLTGAVPRNLEEAASLAFPAPQQSAGKDVDGDAPTARGGSPRAVEGFRQIVACCLAAGPEDRFAGADELIDALERVDEINEAASALGGLGITEAQVRCTFCLAKIGHRWAKESLLRWCGDRDDRRHEQAAIALANIDPEGLARMAERALETSPGGDRAPLRRDSLIHALAVVLRHDEVLHPLLRGQPWLWKLGERTRRAVKKAFVSANLAALRKEFFQTFALYCGSSALFAALFWLPAGLFEGNVLWRMYPADVGKVSLVTFLGACSIMPGTIWGSFFGCALQVSRCFERPRRIAAVLVGLLLASLAATILLAGLLGDVDTGPFVDVFGGKAEMRLLFTRFYSTFGIIISLPLVIVLAAKELPPVSKRWRTGVLTVLAMPVAFLLLSPVLLAVFHGSAFRTAELIGTAMNGLGVVFGIGLADYVAARRR